MVRVARFDLEDEPHMSSSVTPVASNGQKLATMAAIWDSCCPADNMNDPLSTMSFNSASVALRRVSFHRTGAGMSSQPKPSCWMRLFALAVVEGVAEVGHIVGQGPNLARLCVAHHAGAQARSPRRRHRILDFWTITPREPAAAILFTAKDTD